MSGERTLARKRKREQRATTDESAGSKTILEADGRAIISIGVSQHIKTVFQSVTSFFRLEYYYSLCLHQDILFCPTPDDSLVFRHLSSL